MSLENFRRYYLYIFNLEDEKACQIDFASKSYLINKIKKVIEKPYENTNISNLLQTYNKDFDDLSFYILQEVVCSKGNIYDYLIAYIKKFKDQNYKVAASKNLHEKTKDLSEEQKRIYEEINFDFDILKDKSKEYELYEGWKNRNLTSQTSPKEKEIRIRMKMEDFLNLEKEAKELNLATGTLAKNKILQDSIVYNFDISANEKTIDEARTLVSDIKNLTYGQLENKEIYRAEILEISEKLDDLRRTMSKILLETYESENRIREEIKRTSIKNKLLDTTIE